MTDNIILLASFDIGKKNFAFYIEEVRLDHLTSIKNISTCNRYNEDGTPTPQMKTILEEVYDSGRTILHKNYDLTKDCDPKKTLDPNTFHNMIEVLDKYASYWDKCSVFVIEEQMSFGKKLNKMAVKLGQHCYSYFAFKYGKFKSIIEFPAYNKTQILGAYKVEGKPYKNGKKRWKAMEKHDRKKWSVILAEEILTNRGEIDILEGLTSKKKKDDLADTLTQLQAFKYLAFVDKKI